MKPEANDRDRWVPIAEVARPHGVRGELRLKLFNPDSDALLGAVEVLVRLPSGEEHEVSIDGARRADKAILLKLFSVDDRSRADDLRGALLCMRRSSLPAVVDGEFYACDVEGARVVVDGLEIGVVEGLRSYPSVDTLAVRATDGGADFEVPVLAHFVVSVDAAGRLVTLVSLEGLR